MITKINYDVLTQNGFKSILNISKNDILWTYNKLIDKFETNQIQQINTINYNGDIYEVTSKNINCLLLPSNNFISKDINCNVCEINIVDAFERMNHFNKNSLLKYIYQTKDNQIFLL